MQRILNNPDNIVDEMLAGFVKCHSDIVKHVVTSEDNPRGVIAAADAPRAGKVGVVTGGGSGHKPAFIGYVGKNMCDAAAVGEICSSPTALAFLEAFRAANGGAGVACLYGNYSGDNMNVKMAVKMAAKEGLEVKTVVANDDVASAPKDQRDKRRGVAGEIFMWKCGGAKAAQGASLDEVIATAQKAIDNCRSVGIGLTPCTLPAVGHPNFEIKDGTMEVGIGHHGEPGIEVCALETAAQMAQRMVDVVVPDYPFQSGDEVACLVSGLGATPVMELYVLYDEIEKILAAKGIKVYRSYVGNYFTSLDMMGATLTLMKLDDELKSLVDVEVYTMGMKQGNLGQAAATQSFAAGAVQAASSPAAGAVAHAAGKKASRETHGAVVKNANGRDILLAMVKGIQDNKQYLGDVDGLIGDGDHGMNMNKGFTLYEEELGDKATSLTDGLYDLGNVLFNKIGGSMGPIYGTVLQAMSEKAEGQDAIDLTIFGEMLEAGLEGLYGIVGARPGDKTLVDTLYPACEAVKKAAAEGKDFAAALDEMKAAAEAGKDSTVDLVAKFGRASRLGERSRGVLDAGATSCCIILQAMADGMKAVLE